MGVVCDVGGVAFAEVVCAEGGVCTELGSAHEQDIIQNYKLL